eukprot:UN09494
MKFLLFYSLFCCFKMMIWRKRCFLFKHWWNLVKCNLRAWIFKTLLR